MVREGREERRELRGKGNEKDRIGGERDEGVCRVF